MRPSTRKRLKQRTSFFTRARQRKLRIVAPGEKKDANSYRALRVDPKSRGTTVWAGEFLSNGPHLFKALAVLPSSRVFESST